ncbi:MAG: imidazole glycerol phosphate synthase subunit HisF [Candidatus Acidiferrales bacterium]
MAELAAEFGSQAVVLAIDAKQDGEGWRVFVRGGHEAVAMDAIVWACQGVERGAGEILITSIDRDGTRSGYDCKLTAVVASAVRVPVIASGGADSPGHFLEVFTSGQADAALAASIFHQDAQSISGLKKFLHERGVTVRLSP